MRHAHTELYVHCVWATWERLPLITPQIEDRLYACIADKCRELGCELIALRGVADHIHLLVCFPPTLEIARLVKEAKGVSSHLMTHDLSPNDFFKWQGAYGAFTVQKDRVPAPTSYIKSQKAHHASGKLVEQWEHWDTDEPI
jgi:putative transposase